MKNLFISLPIESAQDVTELQFGFMVGTIEGVNKEDEEEDEKSEKDISMEEEEKDDPNQEISKSKEKDQVDENESKVLEQISNKKKSILKNQSIIFTQSEGIDEIILIFEKYFQNFKDFLENVVNEKINSSVHGHRKTLSFNINGVKNMIPAKYKNEPIIRLLLARLLSWFSLFLSFKSSDFENLVSESNILKDIILICEIYDDHTLIQAEIRTIFSHILGKEDLNLKKRFLNDSRCIFLFAKKLNMVDFNTQKGMKK